jgi:hypothetical protein
MFEPFRQVSAQMDRIGKIDFENRFLGQFLTDFLERSKTLSRK